MTTLSEQITCIARELKIRQRVYSKWVDTGKMQARVSENEISAISAVLATLQEFESKEEGLGI